MVLNSLLTSITHTIGRLSHCIPSTSQAITTLPHNPYRQKANVGSCSYRSRFWRQPLTHLSFSDRSHKDLLAAPLGAKSSEPGEDDSQPLEAVLKLYSAIKNKNVRELAHVIGDECQCWCNFFSTFRTSQGKKQVLDFFSCLITSLGDNIDFVVIPTMQHGMRVGIKWKIEWKSTHVPLGKGFSIHICHVYHGKVSLGFTTTLLEKMRNKAKSVLQVFLGIFITTALLFLLKYVLLH